MLPKFDPDDIIYVEPETGLLALKNNDLVVVQCNGDTEATFKQLVMGEKSDEMYLRPLNQSELLTIIALPGVKSRNFEA